jgi:hypothetical protein
MVGDAIIIGVLSGILVVSLASWMRASFVRAQGGESYSRGWKDAIKKVNEQLSYPHVALPPDREKEGR